LLFSEAINEAAGDFKWHFALQPIGSGEPLFAEDVEADVSGDRLELLSVVRGLEALAQPSRVTLLTKSRYVRRGIGHDLGEWRARGWRWERFGRLVPIRDQDLWQRLDRGLTIHEVACWPCPQEGETPVAADESAAVTTFSIASAGANEPCLEPAVVIVRQKQPSVRMVSLHTSKRTRHTAQHWTKSNRPELSRTA
jgi:ribonuclease HI